MALSVEQKKNVEEALRLNLRKRFEKYNPEPASMPFHTRLLGKDRLALYSFLHSLNTNFGTSIFEPVALALAQNTFRRAETQYVSGKTMSAESQRVIQDIMDGLTAAHASPNKAEEIEKIRMVCQAGEMKKVKPTRVDLFLELNEGEMYLIDIKTAKPNAGAFKEFKRTLLEWVAVTLAQNPNASIQTLIAIPYNPYEPKQYNRWTMRGMLELEKELKVADEFWDFLAGRGTYEDLLVCFEHVGIEMREEIDVYFQKFRS